MNNADAAALERACSLLPQDLAEVVRRLASEPWQRRDARKKQRDAAVRQALELIEGSATVRACELERRLSRYETGNDWKHDRLHGLPDDAPALRICMAQVLTHGRALKWRQIMNIAKAGEETL